MNQVLCKSALFVMLTLGVCALSAGQVFAQSAERSPKQLLVHYMPWYETPEVRGQWGSHWTGHQQQHDPSQIGEDGLPDIWSHYHPLIGLYDSADPAVLECQLLQMKLAGADGVIVDWYGIADAADYPPIHEATQVLFEATVKLGMAFAVCYEDRTVEFMVNHGQLTTEDIADHLSETFAWLDEHWFSSPNYVRIDDRPLLLNFGPIYIKDASIWDTALGSVSPRPAFFALHHLWQGIGADGGFTWVHKDVFDDGANFRAVNQRLTAHFNHSSNDRNEIIISAFPGFHDVYDESFGFLDHRDGQTLEQTLAVGMAGDWPIIQLAAWNDYGEGTILEPTHEFGYTFLEIIQDARRQEQGADFKFSSDDLKLPARLLKQRRLGNASPSELNQVTELLSDGNTKSARTLLQKIESAQP
ncbi:MAG: glycoside hydrolase family 71/99-like protein [Planctomycetota bacterium]